MAIPVDVQAALDRLVQYNSNPVGAGNPYGMGNYGNLTNFPAALSDVSAVADWFGTTGGLPGPEGDPGADGREIELQKSATHLQWRYVGEAAWINLVPLADLVGAKGDKGDTGDKGDQGDSFTVNAVGLLADRDTYDGEAAGFSYLATDNSLIYFRVGGTGWSAGVPFGKGDKGDPGDPGTTDYLELDNLPTLGTAAAKDAGTAAGNVPVLDAGGKLDTSVLPALAINDVFVAASQAAMLALDAQRGDVAVRSDVSKTFILSADAPSVLANWVELPVPADTVLSVAGLTGAISAASLRVALELVVGTHVQGYSEALTSIAGLTPTNGNVITGNGTTWVSAAAAGGSEELFIAIDEKTAGTDGGTFFNGSWNTRTLNTIKQNSIAGASLSANLITLPAGVYDIEASAPAAAVNAHKVRLFNQTSAQQLLVGSTENSSTSDYSNTRSKLVGTITLSSSAQLALQHACQTSNSNSQGRGISGGSWSAVPDVYAQIKIRKIG